MASDAVSDFKIEMAPDGGAVRLRITDRANPTGQDFAPRPLPQLDAGRLDRLRQDQANAEEVAAVQAAVASWLFDSGVDVFLRAALNALPANTRLRLVLGIHPQLWPALGELPFELLPWSNDALLLHPKVASLVYQLPESGADAPLDSHGPLRVLLVRASPQDLGDVPEAAPIRNDWTASGAAASRGSGVQVEWLSRDESGSLGAATWAAVRQRLKEGRPDLLVYLGHGQVDTSKSPPVAAVQLEQPPDAHGYVYSHAVAAATLATWLHNYPVPVVVLASCLTAFEGVEAPRRTALERLAPAWARGNQGVAQALVNSRSGVRVGIGMRYNLNTEAAKTMLRALVASLLGDEQPGDIEAAVRAARLEMRVADDTSPAWSAPVVFVAPGPPLVLPLGTSEAAAIPPRSAPTTQADVTDLYQRLLNYTDMEDLYDLAFRLRLDADAFDTRTKLSFARGLLDRLENQGRIEEFLKLLRQAKPWVLR